MKSISNLIDKVTGLAAGRMSDMPLSKKVIIGFAAVAGSAGVGVAIALMSLLVAQRSVSTITELGEVTNEIAIMELAAFEAQGTIKDYLISTDEGLVAAVEAQLARANEAIADVREGATAIDEAERVKELEAALAEHARLFKQIVAAQRVLQGKPAKVLDERGPAIGTMLGEIVDSSYRAGNYTASYHAAEALEDYSLARIAVNEFRSNSSEVAADAASQSLLELEDSMNLVFEALDDPALSDRADQIIVDLVEYDTAFEKLVAMTKVRDAKVAKLLTEVGPAFEKAAFALSDEVRGAQENASTLARATGISAMVVTLFAVLGALFVVFIAWTLSRITVVKPLTRMVDAMRKLASGERDIEIDTSDRADEIGQMARAIVVFREHAVEVERGRQAAIETERRERDADAERQREREAERERAEAEKREALAKLADTFESSIRGVATAVANAAQQIEVGAKRVAGSANDSAMVAADVATAAEQSSQNAMAVANASEEMARSIAEVSAQVVESSSRSEQASARARSTDKIVAGLAEDASKIGEVVELINSIAEQTNLLALNATIEAARAGDAGRGFAVVAGEIKALASQTSKATVEISQRISAVQSVSDEAVKAIEEIVTAIGDINGIAATVAAAVEQQSATTSEIAVNTQQAASGSQNVAKNIDRVRGDIEATGDAARESLAAAAELSKQADTLQHEVDHFLARVRAA